MIIRCCFARSTNSTRPFTSCPTFKCDEYYITALLNIIYIVWVTVWGRRMANGVACFFAAQFFFTELTKHSHCKHFHDVLKKKFSNLLYFLCVTLRSPFEFFFCLWIEKIVGILPFHIPSGATAIPAPLKLGDCIRVSEGPLVPSLYCVCVSTCFSVCVRVFTSMCPLKLNINKHNVLP